MADLRPSLPVDAGFEQREDISSWVDGVSPDSSKQQSANNQAMQTNKRVGFHSMALLYTESDDLDNDGSVVDSTKSRILEGYPALASYAINRVFVHAQAGFALSVDPKDVLDKLVGENCWPRWCVLQEGVADLKSWQDVLKSQNLGTWIRVWEDMNKHF